VGQASPSASGLHSTPFFSLTGLTGGPLRGGTDGSNPAPSSGESANQQFRCRWPKASAFHDARSRLPLRKQHLAAIRHLFDWLVVGQVLAVNPAHAVRGPKHVIKRGKTPVLTEDQARRLLASIDTSTLVGLRDRALLGIQDRDARASVGTGCVEGRWCA
jgi:hypothetical protein